MSALISYDQKNRSFHLHNGSISYIMQIVKDNYLLHHYFGSFLPSFNYTFAYKGFERDGCPVPASYGDERVFSLDSLRQEFPTFGCGDYRVPAFKARFSNGTSVVDLRYHSHRIYEGKPSFSQLPYAKLHQNKEAQTLEITLKDDAYDLYVILSYTIFANLDLIIRSSKVINKMPDPIVIETCHSIALDLPDHDYEKIHLYGTHGNERHVERKALGHHIESVASARCASSQQHSPFIALVRPDTTEDHGEVIASSLIWSGNFEATTEVSHFGPTRLLFGINSFDFKYCLEQDEEFLAPEGVLVYSDKGLNHMSHIFHEFIGKHIIDQKWQNKARPVLINSWEAAYFDFTEESIVDFAKGAKKAGAELVVLDDGWFGQRDDDFSSLGDWTLVSQRKLPNGINGLCQRINDLGLEFGLWFDPEAISPRSEIYKQHPDWVLHVPNRAPSQSRSECVINLARQEVIDYVFEAMSTILSSANISYVKTDMTRSPAELYVPNLPAHKQGEVAYRYQLGVYQLFNRLNQAFPHILFEGCAGGGRRFDMGMLFYEPQIWTSDNTDAMQRLKIQYGTSLVYPNFSIGAHVSASPNHQVGRSTSLTTRFICAISGNLGYELDLNKLSEEEQVKVKEHIDFYKKYRLELQYGKLYRCISPFAKDQNHCAWNIISPDQKHVFGMYFKVLAHCNPDLERFKFKGLDPLANYKVLHHIMPKAVTITMGQAFNHIIEQTGEQFSGAELMQYGLIANRVDCDFCAYFWLLEKQ